MSNTIWVLTEGQESDDWDHSVMLKIEKILNKLCKSIGLKPFSELLDYSILEEEYSDESFEQNYQAATTVLAVLVPLRDEIFNGKGGIKENIRTEVLEELDDCISKVQIAKSKGTEVRLSIVP